MSHSLTLSESSTPRVGRGRVQLLLILAVVIGPMLLASAMYHWRFWVPEGRSYHGELIATGCLNVGGRLLKFDDAGRLTYCSPVLQGRFPLEVGAVPAPQTLRYGFELWERSPSFEALRQSLCRQLEQECGGNVDTDQLRNETLAQIVAELGSSFTQEIVYQDLCARHHINPSYLSQLFRKELGMTFTSYLNQLRIHYAKELLQSTSLRVAEISDKVGYDNYLHFTKLFKRETGTTPKQYRLELKARER